MATSHFKWPHLGQMATKMRRQVTRTLVVGESGRDATGCDLSRRHLLTRERCQIGRSSSVTDDLYGAWQSLSCGVNKLCGNNFSIMPWCSPALSAGRAAGYTSSDTEG